MFRFGPAGPIALLSAGLVALGCTDRSPTSPGSIGEVVESPTVTADALATPDVSGTWSWSSVERLKFPPFIALALGLQPEGENTHARCESAGTMELTQSGSSFEGTAEKLFNACMTRGGQGPFQQPESDFFVDDGHITGGSAHFSFASATVRPCPHTAVIEEVSEGVAMELSGTGFCYLPNHPQSESPSDLPPPAGTTKTLSWEAHR